MSSLSENVWIHKIGQNVNKILLFNKILQFIGYNSKEQYNPHNQ